MAELSWISTLLALVGSGVIAGVFFAFSSFVMGALTRRPPLEGMAAMQAINATVLNWHFLGTFFVTALLSLGAIVCWGARGWSGDAVFLGLGGVLYFGGTFLVTVVCNVPLNKSLDTVAATDPGAEEQWQQYADRWTRWNHVRTVAAMLATAAFAIALRSTG